MLIAQYIDNQTFKNSIDSNIQTRLQLVAEALKNDTFRHVVYEKCKNNFFFWLEFFCWTYDPRPDVPMPVMPFIPFEYQVLDSKKIINSIKTGEDLLAEKARDMGFTWLVSYIFQWFWQFHAGSNFLIGSKKLENVDKLGDPSCIFEKLRLNIRKQPAFLLPKGFSKSEHLPFCKIANPENGNAITGESANADFGRSGRYKAILFDEFAFWDLAHLAWGASSESTKCRLAVSTSFGKGNKFAELRHSGKIEVLTRHWTAHPRKTKNLIKLPDGSYTSDWYEKQKQRMTATERARELDIDYLTSREGAVYKFNRRLHVIDGLKEEICKDKDTVIYRVWDFGLFPAVLFFANTPYGTRLLRELTPDDNPTLSKFVTSVNFYSLQEFSGFSFVDRCDIAGNQRNHHTNQTSIDILNEAGIYPDSDKVPIEDGIDAVQSLLDRQDGFLIDSKCTVTTEAFEGGYFRKEDKTGMNRVLPPVEVHPYEDVMDCVRYHIWAFYRPTRFTKSKTKKSTPQYYEDFEI